MWVDRRCRCRLLRVAATARLQPPSGEQRAHGSAVRRECGRRRRRRHRQHRRRQLHQLEGATSRRTRGAIHEPSDRVAQRLRLRLLRCPSSSRLLLRRRRQRLRRLRARGGHATQQRGGGDGGGGADGRVQADGERDVQCLNARGLGGELQNVSEWRTRPSAIARVKGRRRDARARADSCVCLPQRRSTRTVLSISTENTCVLLSSPAAARSTEGELSGSGCAPCISAASPHTTRAAASGSGPAAIAAAAEAMHRTRRFLVLASHHAASVACERQTRKVDGYTRETAIGRPLRTTLSE